MKNAQAFTDFNWEKTHEPFSVTDWIDLGASCMIVEMSKLSESDRISLYFCFKKVSNLNANKL